MKSDMKFVCAVLCVAVAVAATCGAVADGRGIRYAPVEDAAAELYAAYLEQDTNAARHAFDATIRAGQR